MSSVNMDKIMAASFGESSSTVNGTFKRTINVKQYETETIEISSSLNMAGELSGVERMLVSTILQAQLEYSACVQMRCKGYITDSQFSERKRELEEDVELIKCKAEELLGKSMDYLFDIASE